MRKGWVLQAGRKNEKPAAHNATLTAGVRGSKMPSGWPAGSQSSRQRSEELSPLHCRPLVLWNCPYRTGVCSETDALLQAASLAPHSPRAAEGSTGNHGSGAVGRPSDGRVAFALGRRVAHHMPVMRTLERQAGQSDGCSPVTFTLGVTPQLK